MSDGMDEIIEDFVTEAEESLEKIDPLFVELEKGYDREILNDIFRSMHTIKGAAGLRVVKIEPEFARFTLVQKGEIEKPGVVPVPPKIEEPPPGMGRVWTNLTVLAREGEEREADPAADCYNVDDLVLMALGDVEMWSLPAGAVETAED